MPDDYMTEDQRFATRRPDVLVYDSAARKRPRDRRPIDVDLWVSTTGTDSDFVVKLIDAYPEDCPDSDPTTTSRLAATSTWCGRAVPRQVPRRLHDAAADGAGRARAHPVLDARRRSRLPPRPTGRTPGGELVVPAGRSQSTDLHRHPHRNACSSSAPATQRVYRLAGAQPAIELSCAPRRGEYHTPG